MKRAALRVSLGVAVTCAMLAQPERSAAVAAVPSPSASDTVAQPDAVTILDRARATVAARRIPPYIAYTEDAALVHHGKVQAQHERVVVRMSDGKANITPVPDSLGDRVDTTPIVKDRPLVYPTTTFGLVKRRSGEAPSQYEADSTPEPAPDSGGLPVIGRVSAAPRDYDPTLIGIEELDGARVYHLKLVPRSDPRRHPIRDLYVDTTTYDPRRIDIEVFAAAGPAHSRPTLVVDFAPVDGTWMISHAAMDFVLRLAFLSYGGSGAYQTHDISFPASEPDWMFDPKALTAHEQAARPRPN